MVELAYQDPATWLELGQPDPILEEVSSYDRPSSESGDEWRNRN